MPRPTDRKSTRLNSSHHGISYAVFCLKKKKEIVGGEFAGAHAVASTADASPAGDARAFPVASRQIDIVFFFNDTAPTEIYTLSLHAALPISREPRSRGPPSSCASSRLNRPRPASSDRKITRLDSSHHGITYAGLCVKKN